MLSLLLDIKLLSCFAEFIVLYLGSSPSIEAIGEYLKVKLEEKDILDSYEAGLITQDEVCSFLSAHLYTGFVLNQEGIQEVSNEEVNAFHQRIKSLLFEK